MPRRNKNVRDRRQSRAAQRIQGGKIRKVKPPPRREEEWK